MLIKVLFVIIIIAVIWLCAVMFIRKVWFYRDPDRKPEASGNVLVAPCDGQVVYIKKVEVGKIAPEKKGEIIKVSELTKTDTGMGKGWLIGIYMSPLDVHYNYSPYDAKVNRIVHTQADLNLPMVDLWEYINLTYLRRVVQLFGKKYHLENERNTVVLNNGTLKVILVEIADKFVNKIKCFISEGDRIAISQKISFIDRGSQVDMFICREDVNIKVTVGQQVYGGQTVVATYTEREWEAGAKEILLEDNL